jgi:two-component system response regulator AlgR
MKVLIVDDEPLALLRMEKMLESLSINSCISASNGQQAIDLAKKYHPAVIFLDIEMPVKNGIQAAEEIRAESPESEIIFCTAYDEFAIKAFELSASDYLLKPISQARLKQALDKTSLNSTKATYTYHQGNDLINLGFDDIYCFVSEDKYTIMYCVNGTVIIDDSLILIESKFPEKLLRINRNALINREELCGIHRDKSHAFAKLKSIDYQPQISRRNISSIKELLK